MPLINAKPTPADPLVWVASSEENPDKQYLCDIVHWSCNCPNFTIVVNPENRRDIAKGGLGLGTCKHLSRSVYLAGWKMVQEARIKALSEEEAAQLSP